MIFLIEYGILINIKPAQSGIKENVHEAHSD